MATIKISVNIDSSDHCSNSKTNHYHAICRLSWFMPSEVLCTSLLTLWSHQCLLLRTNERSDLLLVHHWTHADDASATRADSTLHLTLCGLWSASQCDVFPQLIHDTSTMSKWLEHPMARLQFRHGTFSYDVSYFTTWVSFHSILAAVLRVVVNPCPALARVSKISVQHHSLNAQEPMVIACIMPTSSVTGWPLSIKTINSKCHVKKHWNQAITETRSVAVRFAWKLNKAVDKLVIRMATTMSDKHWRNIRQSYFPLSLSLSFVFSRVFSFLSRARSLWNTLKLLILIIYTSVSQACIMIGDTKVI